MPPSRSSLVVNHRVALSGTKARAATHAWHLHYIDSRPGAVRACDLAHAEEREISSYMDGRPGAVRNDVGALFGQRGNVALADAREQMSRCGGAVLRTVVSVRREDAEALRLTTREDWERLLRSRWQQEFASMSGVPESRVRWVAAFHTNQENNLHCHVLSWDAGERAPWDSLLPKARMEAARSRITDAALAPELDRLARERTEARDLAVSAIRSLDLTGEGARLHLPADGSLKYAHLERFHPDAAELVASAARAAVARTPEAAEAVRRHEAAVLAMGGLKGLTGSELDEYVRAAEADLALRLRNAAVSAMVPDRRALAPDERLDYRARRVEVAREVALTEGRTRRKDVIREVPPTEGRDLDAGPSPSTERRREEALRQEISSCSLDRDGECPEGEDDLEGALRRSPSVQMAVRRGMLDLGAAARKARSRQREHDTGSDVARELVATLSRGIARGIAERVAEPSLGGEVDRGTDVDIDLGP